ncbi:MAG: aldo/keto reductase [Chloroflexi bacterium]|nr:aldo/keto reductase [Chloroflexota bacterium]MCY3587414.1 aldo/keto reductase [Chloroflexota bacterium]MCY3685443.1 aldo/keto reductase [Chloroflexota bacterium]MDE2708345.1 aldo/keto reductase [Chloroflexota bacterium]
MEQRQFGNTDLVASAVGFGTWEMSTTMYGHIDVDEAARAVNMAIDRGITLFDTAEVYGPYHSEELLAKALGSRRNEIVLVTKVGFDYDDTPQVIGRNSKKAHIIEHTDDCLRRLNTDFVDLMLIHWPDHDTPIEETMEGLEELKQSGKIRHYGVSNFNIDMMEECEKYGHIAANQVGYNMYDRRMESRVLPWCQANGVGYMAYGSLGFGLLTGAFTPETTFEEGDWRRSGNAFNLPLFQEEHFRKEVEVTNRLVELADGYNKTVAQLALAWVLDHPAVSCALVGMRNERELEENVAATDWKLNEEIRTGINEIFDDVGVPTYQNAPQAT